MSVLRCAGSFLVSFQDRFTDPSDGSTESHWLNWSFATPVGSSFTRSGAPQVRPPSVDRDRKMSVPLAGVWSIHEQYRLPRFGPVFVSAPHAGYTRAPLTSWAGIAMSNGTWVGEMVCVGPKLWPPSAELASTIWLPVMSCQATCRVPSGATKGSAPMTARGPLPVPLAATGAENVWPASVDRLTRMTSLAEDWPAFRLALSQAA